MPSATILRISVEIRRSGKAFEICFLASKESSYQFDESSPIAKIEDFSRTVKEDIKKKVLEYSETITPLNDGEFIEIEAFQAK